VLPTNHTLSEIFLSFFALNSVTQKKSECFLFTKEITMNQALIVDDGAAEREQLTNILRDAGWMVQVSANGDDAVRKAKIDKPNIIFMDIVMPGMDGYQATRKLAEDPETRGIPVVFVSTKSQRADQVWARMQGGKELISKPYSANQILDALKHAA
jgi:twitching motility two-component system response regulator PilH